MRNNFYLFIAFFLLNCLAGLSLAEENEKSVIWQLHYYNGWDLPFAKTVELNTTDPKAPFPTANYKLKIDPNAYFSFVFTPPDPFDL